jgi:hypothetical protein
VRDSYAQLSLDSKIGFFEWKTPFAQIDLESSLEIKKRLKHAYVRSCFKIAEGDLKNQIARARKLELETNLIQHNFIHSLRD